MKENCVNVLCDPVSVDCSIPTKNNYFSIIAWNSYSIYTIRSILFIIHLSNHKAVFLCRTIVSAKERRLKKGTGFHLNIMVLGILNGALSMFGMPWVCCATVRSITHANR